MRRRAATSNSTRRSPSSRTKKGDRVPPTALYETDASQRQAQVPAFFPFVRQLFEQHSLDAEQA
jgi:hypothetical protein